MKIKLSAVYDTAHDTTRYWVERSTWWHGNSLLQSFSDLDEAQAFFRRLKAAKGESRTTRLLDEFEI